MINLWNFKGVVNVEAPVTKSGAPPKKTDSERAKETLDKMKKTDKKPAAEPSASTSEAELQL